MSTTRNTPTRTRAARGFTLVELLVTIGLMALLATLATTGYYAASRGMADRGAVTDAKSIIRSAMQRALIDQVPTAVLFYNQRLRDDSSDDESEICVGTAVAIRMSGRFSHVFSDMLVDQFADLQQTYPTTQLSAGGDSGMRIYRMASVDEGYEKCKTIVESSVRKKDGINEYLVASVSNLVNVSYWGFKYSSRNANANWKVGDAYASEIASLQLPHGYIFGSSKPTRYEATTPAGTKALIFNPLNATMDMKENQTDFSFANVEIYALRPGSGGTSLQKVDSFNKVDD
ncbi:MAG: Tfp pilus assembly protein FimT/FimU [Kiritimatiellia bacterium]